MDSVKDHLQQKLKSKFVCFWSLRSTFKIFASFRNHRRAGLFLSNSNYNRYNSVNLNTTFDCHCGCISNTAIGNFKKVFVHFLCQNLFFLRQLQNDTKMSQASRHSATKRKQIWN